MQPFPHFASIDICKSKQRALYFEIVMNERNGFLHTVKARSCSLLSTLPRKKYFAGMVTHFAVIRRKNVLQDKIHN